MIHHNIIDQNIATMSSSAQLLSASLIKIQTICHGNWTTMTTGEEGKFDHDDEDEESVFICSLSDNPSSTSYEFLSCHYVDRTTGSECFYMNVLEWYHFAFECQEDDIEAEIYGTKLRCRETIKRVLKSILEEARTTEKYKIKVPCPIQIKQHCPILDKLPKKGKILSLRKCQSLWMKWLRQQQI
jgi:hypothetical protein